MSVNSARMHSAASHATNGVNGTKQVEPVVKPRRDSVSAILAEPVNKRELWMETGKLSIEMKQLKNATSAVVDELSLLRIDLDRLKDGKLEFTEQKRTSIRDEISLRVKSKVWEVDPESLRERETATQVDQANE